MNLDQARIRLTDFDARARREALDALASAHESGHLPRPPRRGVVNMHCHTFYSYNGYGHSPESLAWLAAEEGWRALATVDFDVLDGVAETLAACDRVRIRAASGLETRTYLPEFARWEVNSPGEPGVLYHVGLGFTSPEAPPAARKTLAAMRAGAERRNREMVERINAHLAPVTIDYAREVLPLTPRVTPLSATFWWPTTRPPGAGSPIARRWSDSGPSGWARPRRRATPPLPTSRAPTTWCARG